MVVFGRRKKIQATDNVEGAKNNMDIASGLTWVPEMSGIGGTTHDYLTYGSQLMETYRKYRGMSEFGCSLVRTVVDTRTAFIAGEGLSVSSEDETFAEWARKFLDDTKLSGSLFFEAVMGSEMSGRALFVLEAKPGERPELFRVPYSDDTYSARREAAWKNEAKEIIFKSKDGTPTARIPKERFVYIRTGGDDREWDQPCTRIGVVLTECEGYDRALSDIRRTNYTVSRITPTFKTENDAETDALKGNLSKIKWKIGQAFIGKATFKYETAGTGSVENLKTEMASSAKAISATTGVPVHWLGWTDLMSNRATAEELYTTISNATSRERTLFAEAIKALLIKAQVLYIDNGGTELSEVNTEFGVSITTLDYSRFETMIRALSTAYADEAISMDDYRSFIPGIDPLRTKEAVEEAKKENQKRFMDSLLSPEGNAFGKSKKSTKAGASEEPVKDAETEDDK